MDKKKVKEDMVVEKGVDMAKEEEKKEVVTIVIIMKEGMINLTLNVSIAISMVIFHGSVKLILNVIIAISMIIFLGSVNPMLKKRSILLMIKKKMKSQHYC